MDGESGEFYRPLATEKVVTKSDPIEVLHGQNENRPFVEERLPVAAKGGRWMRGVEDAWDRARRLVGWPKEKKPKFGRWVAISKTSGRTMTDALVSNHAVWDGPLDGDIYGATDIKGSRHDISLRGIKRDKNGYLGLRAEGLKDIVGTGFIEQASFLLRSYGLPTECVVRKEKLKEIAVGNGQKMFVEKWKAWALRKYSRDIQKRTDVDGFDKKDLIRQAKEYMKDNDFYLVERDLQVQERLRDVGLCKTEEQFSRMMGPVLKWLRVATSAKDSGLISGTVRPDEFVVSNEQDVKKYFSTWLPEQMGIYLGRMHDLGLAHNFLHAQNWSAVGTVYDLDSVVGQGMPKGIARGGKEFERDIKFTMGSLEELLDPPTGNYLSNRYGDELADQARANFIKMYCKTRGLDPIYLDLGGSFRNTDYYDGYKWTGGMTDEEWDRVVRLVFTG